MLARRLVIIEALTSGAGLGLVHSALRTGLPTTFLTRDVGRYRNDSRKELLQDPALDVRVVETASAEDVTEVFAELAGTAELVLIAPNELFIGPASVAARKLDIPFLSDATVTLGQDKQRFRQACAAAGIPAPVSVAVLTEAEAQAAAERTGFPAVLKPSVGTGSYGVIAVADADALATAFPSVAEEARKWGGVPLLESFLVGPVISAEVLVADGRMHLLGITDRIMSPLPHFVETAVRFPVRLDADTEAAVTDSCRRLVELLEFGPGPAHIEFSLTEDGPMAIEFNPRLGGGTLSRLVSSSLGTDLYDLIVAACLGQPVHVPEPVGGASEHSLYSQRVGRFTGLRGVELARRVRGTQDVLTVAELGSTVGPPKDQRDMLAALWCTGANAEDAGMRSASAISYLTPVIED